MNISFLIPFPLSGPAAGFIFFPGILGLAPAGCPWKMGAGRGLGLISWDLGVFPGGKW